MHETESQLIRSGSRDVNFTMDLVLKDIGLFQKIADGLDIPLEISPQIISIMRDGQSRFGDWAQSNRIIERLTGNGSERAGRWLAGCSGR